MKFYLARFEMLDGEHEHVKHFIVKAENKEEAERIAKTQEHEPIIRNPDEDVTYWDYGDGTTAVQFEYSTEISEAETQRLEALGVVHLFN